VSCDSLSDFRGRTSSRYAVFVKTRTPSTETGRNPTPTPPLLKDARVASFVELSSLISESKTAAAATFRSTVISCLVYQPQERHSPFAHAYAISPSGPGVQKSFFARVLVDARTSSSLQLPEIQYSHWHPAGVPHFP